MKQKRNITVDGQTFYGTPVTRSIYQVAAGLLVNNYADGTEYPEAALNTYFDADDHVLTFGLCNDAIGYIVPDNDYNAKESHEMISVGPKAASSISRAFAELINEYK